MRRRNKENEKLPQYVYKNKSCYVVWTPRLRQAIELAKKKQSNRFCPYLFQMRGGVQRSTKSAKDAFTKLMKKWSEETGNSRYTYHDLKAKGVSDFNGNKVDAGGWKSAAMVNTYDRKVLVVKSTK